MAYTNNPVYNTQQTKRIPIQGSAIPSDYRGETSANFYANAVCVNCYPTSLKQWHGDPVNVLTERSGWEEIPAYWNGGTPSANSPRGFFSPLLITGPFGSINLQYVAYGNTLYLDTGVTKPLQYTSGYVGFTEYRVDSTYYVVILENHATAAYLHLYDPVGDTITSVNLGIGAQADPVFLDGYIFLLAAGDRQRIYNSTIGAPDTFSTSTDFIDCEMFADGLSYIALHKNHIVGFGRYSIEFFYDNANQLGSPLSRNTAYAQTIGFQRLSVNLNRTKIPIKIGDDIYFIGNTRQTDYRVYKLSNFQLTDISSSWVQRIITGTSYLTLSQEKNSPSLILTQADSTNLKNLSYNIEDNVWTRYDFGKTTYSSGLYPVSSAFRGDDFYIIAAIPGSTPTTGVHYTLCKINKFAAIDAINAIYTTDEIDFGSNNSKEIRNVELIGNFQGQSVKLEYSKDRKDDLQSTWTDMGTINTATADSNTPIRWRELGWGNHWKFRFTFTSNEQANGKAFLMRGFEVTYIQHND